MPPIETRGYDRKYPFTWSFCFMPNACYAPPHLGHFFHVANLRYLYWWVYRMRHENSWPVRLQFNVFFDCNPTQELADRYIKMLEWCDWPVDQITSRDEWLKVTQGPVHALHSRANMLVNHVARLPFAPHVATGDPQRLLHKILYWTETGVYWIVRGPDLIEQTRQEEAANAYLPFRLPYVFYHPHIADENGVKLDAQTVTPEYSMDDLIGSDVKPDEVMRAALEKADFTPANGGNVSALMDPDKQWTGAPRAAPPSEFRIIQWIQPLYAPSNAALAWWDATHLRCCLAANAGSHVRVPRNWRDNIRTTGAK